MNPPRPAATILAPLCSAREGARIVGVTPQAVRIQYRKGKIDGDDSLGVLVVRRDEMVRWRAQREQRARAMAF